MMNLSTINYANKKSLILILFFGFRNIIKIDNNHKYRIIIIIDYYGRKARRKIGNSRISRRKWKEMDQNVNGWSENDDDERIYSGQQKERKLRKKLSSSVYIMDQYINIVINQPTKQEPKEN